MVSISIPQEKNNKFDSSVVCYESFQTEEPKRSEVNMTPTMSETCVIRVWLQQLSVFVF